MNYHLFSAFLLITFVLVIVPGPIVTLIIATGATRGVGAALLTTAGSTVGNALLLTCIALGLNWILKTSSEVFEVMRWIGAAGSGWAFSHGDMPAAMVRPCRRAGTSTFGAALRWR
jgi:homoserine/homoserine lactone efflux protein